MALGHEFERHIQAERERGNNAGVEVLTAQLQVFNALVKSGMLQELSDPTLKTPETQGEIKRFSKEALEFLKKKDLLHYPLNGQSLKAQKLAGRPFWYIVDVSDEFLTLPSMQSEVAFHPSPDKFFLPESKNFTLPQQQEMIAEYSYKLQREFGSEEIEAVMGDVPDYTLLAFLHLDATKGEERLFGEKYGYKYARTKTPTSISGVASVGGFNADRGFNVDDWHAAYRGGGIFEAPLIVPVSGTK